MPYPRRTGQTILAASLVLGSSLALMAPPPDKGLDRYSARPSAPALAQTDGTVSPVAGYLYRQHNSDGTTTPLQAQTTLSAAREWNEVLLTAIRNDKARPTVHARNLYHVSAAMWDAWAAYDSVADQVFHQEKLTPPVDPGDLLAAREEAIAYAAYRILLHRFTPSVGAPVTIPACNALMAAMSLDPLETSTVGVTPSAIGNRIAETIITHGLTDTANEQNDYDNMFYLSANPPLVPALPGNPELIYPDRWQPLAIDFIDQGGVIIPLGSLTFLSPEWGSVTPFALTDADKVSPSRDGHSWPFYHDPGPPPLFGDPYYTWGTEMVAVWSSHLDPATGVMVDVSPRSFGNSPLPLTTDYAAYYDFFNGGDWGTGRQTNPATGVDYAVQTVPMGDYARILAEFWADGPESETPPGHWFTLLNYVSDHPSFSKQIEGTGPVLDDLEWDVKAYLAMGGAMHDCAVAAWGCKGYYDYIRPVSALRHMAGLGQSTDPTDLATYHPDGITLRPGYIERVTLVTTAPGQKHEHLAGSEGKIALKAWRGPDYIEDELVDVAGVGWILADNWWPYQRPTFVTPPFAGYVSGHSTFSRAAAELMTILTGDEFFPGGVGEFFCPQNEFLVFEDGPSVDVTLQWATYRDASDQTSLSRIWGGIHPPADDLPGRHMGVEMGTDAYNLAEKYFNGTADCFADLNGDGFIDLGDLTTFVAMFVIQDPAADFNGDGFIDLGDISAYVAIFLAGC